MINRYLYKKVKDIEKNIKIINSIDESENSLDEFIKKEEDELKQKTYYKEKTVPNEKYFTKLNDEIFNHLIHNEISNEKNDITSFTSYFLKRTMNIFKIGFATCICIAITNYMINTQNLFTSQDDMQRYNEKMTKIENTVNENFSKVSSLMKLSIKDTTNKITENIISK